MIKSLDLQNFVFTSKRSRLELLEYSSLLEKNYKILICRNHSFELIEHTMAAYLDFAGLNLEFIYSAYDDSLSFIDIDLSADMLLIWLDLDRYNMNNLEGFIHERLAYLQNIYKKPIIFAGVGQDITINHDNIIIYSFKALLEELGPRFFDLRLASFAGTKMSSESCLAVSKDLGLNYIPSILKNNLKCIVADLDNTLYQGVLGEDGFEGIILSDGHLKLQEKLKNLSAEGYFICIASKNDEKDVEEMFHMRNDFALKFNGFTKIYANWGSKASSVTKIADELNISTESFLFIDDNSGEIISMLDTHQNINVLHAQKNAFDTLEILNNYPRLKKFNILKEDLLRKHDAQANDERKNIAQSLSINDYIKNLQMELNFHIDDPGQINRIAELANKTNQFIFSYQRYSPNEVKDFMEDVNSCVVTVSLSDKLSESGLIGAVFIKKEQSNAVLKECFVSCRALGRGIDEAIVLGLIKIALDNLGLDSLLIQFVKGERNIPAENFISSYLNKYENRPDKFTFVLPDQLLKFFISKGITNER